MNTQTSTAIELSLENAALVQQMLIRGLSYYGEIERLKWRAEAIRPGGHFDERMAPVDPFDDADTTSLFAQALLAVNAWKGSYD